MNRRSIVLLLLAMIVMLGASSGCGRSGLRRSEESPTATTPAEAAPSLPDATAIPESTTAPSATLAPTASSTATVTAQAPTSTPTQAAPDAAPTIDMSGGDALEDLLDELESLFNEQDTLEDLP